VRRSASTLGLVMVLGLGAGACALPGQLGTGDAANAAATKGGVPATPTTAAPLAPVTPPTTVAPTTTTTAAPAPAPAPTGTRNATLWPFASTSPWNTPVGSGAVYEAPGAAKSNAFRTWGVPTWMNSGSYSVPIYIATAADPVVTLNDTVHGTTATARVPSRAVPAGGTDSNMAIVQPDGRTLDVWVATWTSASVLNVQRFAWNDITSSGLGPQGGIRGSGVSTLGGLIRDWEVNPSNPNYRDGVIRHALAVSVPTDMLLWSGGSSGYDANGYGTAKGYQWPASEQDWGSEWTYKGPVPMGSLLAIPKSVDVTKLGLSPAGLQLARAAQDYGAYIVDTSGSGGSVNFYAEPSLSSNPWYTQVTGPNWSAADLAKVRSNMVVISNNGPNSVGGGGSRPVAMAPALG
jgi:hypothetical protein